jgi:hypothetical protein
MVTGAGSPRAARASVIKAATVLSSPGGFGLAALTSADVSSTTDDWGMLAGMGVSLQSKWTFSPKYAPR